MLDDGIHNIRFLATNVTVIGLIILLLFAAVLTGWLRFTDRCSRHPALTFAAFASLAVIISVTLVRDRPAFIPEELFSWSTSGWQRISYDPWSSSENLLNIALFIPAGVAWTLLTKRPLLVTVSLIGLSFLVESLQAVTAAGASDVADLVTNSIGAISGVLAGTVILWASPDNRTRPSVRQLAVGAVCVLAVVVVSIAGLHLGAEQRQSELERELSELFVGTSLDEYDAWLAEDELSSNVFGAASVFADGAQYLDDSVRVRYPASFFGLRRCVYVEWTADDVAVYRSSGTDCSEFLG